MDETCSNCLSKISPESHKGPYTKHKRQLSVETKTKFVKKNKTKHKHKHKETQARKMTFSARRYSNKLSQH